MSNMSENDTPVEITIEEAADDRSIGNETDTKPTATVVPVVPEAVTIPTEEAKPSRTGRSDGTRGRSLKPDSSGTRSRSTSRSSNRRTRRDTTALATADVIPLLPGDEGSLPRQKPPIAGPEMDIDDGPNDARVNYGPTDNRGIDDGFLPEKPTWNDRDRDVGRRIPDRGDNYPAFPYAPEYGPQLPPVIQTTNGARIIPDVNVYQQKKNLAQGMMDLALLSANANQLRYVLESYSRHPYFYFSLAFISTSIICQVAVGIGLIWKSRYNIKNQDDFCKADRLNNMITIGIFIITLVNVLISAFGVAEPPPVV